MKIRIGLKLVFKLKFCFSCEKFDVVEVDVEVFECKVDKVFDVICRKEEVLWFECVKLECENVV